MTIRPIVRQSIRSIRVIVVLSVRVASHPTRHSKSRVNSAPGRANGTALGPRAVHRAPKPPALAAKLQPPGAEVEMPPARHLRPRVLARPRRMPALRADEPLATKRHLNDHRVRPEPDPLHHHPGAETQKPGKCRRDAHAVPPCKPLTFRQPAACRSGRRARRPRVRNVREVLQPAKALLKRTIRLSPCPHSCQEPPRKALSDTELLPGLLPENRAAKPTGRNVLGVFQGLGLTYTHTRHPARPAHPDPTPDPRATRHHTTLARTQAGSPYPCVVRKMGLEGWCEKGGWWTLVGAGDLPRMCPV